MSLTAAFVLLSANSAPAAESSCAAPDVPAGVVHAIQPDLPALAELEHASGSAKVVVSIATDGTVTASRILQSSGNALLDRTALATASATRFRPEIRDCVAVPGSYIYEINFSG